MSRMTVTVDDELIEEAKKALGVTTRADAIRLALREVSRRQRLEAALEHRGKIDLKTDQKVLRRLREQG